MRKYIKQIKSASIAFLSIMFLCGGIISAGAQNADSKGTDFWVAFPGNYSNQDLTLFISGDVSTTGTITAPNVSINFSVTAGTTTSISIPNSFNIQSSDVVENKGIHIQASSEVTVYGVNQRYATTDAFLALPTDILGTEYMILAYRPSLPVQLTLVATEDSTTVTITPSVNSGSRPAGVPYNVSMNKGQTYQLRSGADLTGSVVTSNKPIGVWGGVQCVNIGPGACDYVVEQLPPTSAWGKSFVAYPLATRAYSVIRVLALEDNTSVNINGTVVATLNKGKFYEGNYTTALQVSSDKPVLMAQYATGSNSSLGDPFFMLVPPFEQYLANYVVSTPSSGFSDHYINIIVSQQGLNSVKLDGTTLSSSIFSAIGSSGFYGAAVKVDAGSHTVECPYPIGIHSYGWGYYDSYGYPGGQALSAVAFVDSLSISPLTISLSVDDQHCITAVILDNEGNPVPGIRVDFAVNGANNTGGFANTDTSGKAVYCYVGANGGWDTISVSSGSLSDVATAFFASCNISVSVAVTSDYNGANISCNGAADGSAEAVVSNANGNINYLWSNNAVTSSVNNLGPGIYSVTVIDEKGCEATDSIQITEPSPLSASLSSPLNSAGYNVTCFGGSDGSIDLTVSGGTGSYSYTWSNGKSTQDISGASAGIHYVTVADANGCTVSDTILLTAPSAIIVDAGPDATVYYGYSPMECTILSGSASGSSGSFTYSWSNNTTGSTNNVCPASTTNYTLTATDTYGCTGTDDVTVTSVDVRCGNKNDKVLVCHKRGNNKYHNICISANAVAAHLSQHGDYLGSCGGNKMEEEIFDTVLSMRAYPNPFSNATVVEITLPEDGQAQLELYNVQGRLVQSLFSGEVHGGHPYTFDVNGSNLAAGVYTARLSTAFGVENLKLVLIK